MPHPFKHPKTGIYYLRRKIPNDLKVLLKKGEYKKSLETKDVAVAKVLFPVAWAESDRYFEQARAQQSGESVISQVDAHQIAARWFRTKQAALDKSGRFTDMLEPQTKVFIDQRYGPEEGTVWVSLRDYEGEGGEVSEEEWARVVVPHMQSGMRDLNLPLPLEGSESFDHLFKAFTEHVYKLSDWALRRHEGDVRPLGFDVAALLPLGIEATSNKPSAKERKLTDLFKVYSQEKKLNDGDHRGTKKTLIAYEAIVNRFVELYGDLHVSAIDRELVTRYRADLSKMPSKGEGTRGLSAQALIAKATKEGLPRLTEQTIRNRIRAISGVLSCGVRLGWLEENPIVASGIGKLAAQAASRKQRSTKRRTHFTEAELQTIFSSPIFTDKDWQPPRGVFGKAWYWLPLLYYYTGARREELAQLKAADVNKVEADWCLSILFVQDEDDGGRTVKTTGSRRLVPIHSDLLRRGFLDYVKSVPEDGQLFPLLKADPRGYFGTNFGKRWAQHLRETLNLNSPAKAIHGFRHTFKTLCRLAGIPEDVHDAITGHTGGSGVARDYGAMPLRRMAGELSKFPLAPA